MKSDRRHWNRIFRETPAEKLGWYENDPAPSTRLLNRIPDWPSATIFLPGAGTSVLIETLMDAGAKLVLNDISSEALGRLKTQLGERASSCTWVCQDISRPLQNEIPPIDIWIDRAVLHFLLEEQNIQGYFNNLRSAVKVGGHALFAEFSLSGAPKCAGLELHRYSREELADRLGEGFVLVDQFDHTYINPAGEPRPYLYSLLKREY